MTSTAFTDDNALSALYPAHIDAVTARYERMLERAGAGHCIVYSGSAIPIFLDDYSHEFVANPHFASWLPLADLPKSYIVFTPGERPVLVYFQERDYWHRPPTDPEGYWTAFFDIRVVHSDDEIDVHLPEQRDKCLLIGQVQNAGEARGIERINPTSAMNMLHFDRGVKSPYEIECMRQASRRAVAGHQAAEAAFRAGLSEFDIHLAYCKAVAHSESELPYGNIIALNENGAVLHYQHQSRQAPTQVRSFLIDAGAQVYRYAADITRTWSFAENEFSQLVAEFDVLQQSLNDELRPGVNFADLHLLAHQKIGQFLVDHDFAKGQPAELIEAGVTSAFYPHGLGHLLGIQVHDVGGFMADDSGKTIDRPSGHAFLRLTRDLQAGMVLTVEPGMYVIDMLLDDLEGTPAAGMINRKSIDWLRPYGGIRIEDNIAITDNGYENLTRDAFAAAA